MSAPFVVACPQCGAKLKLKDSSAAGKKLRCPKCQEVFVVPAAGAAGKSGAKKPAKPKDDFDFGGISEDDYEPPPSEEGEEEELDELPQSPVAKRKAGAKGGSKKKRASSGPGVGKIAALAALVLLGIGLVGGIGYGVYLFVQSIGGAAAADRLAWLPDDAEVVFEIRAADLWAAPALQPVINGEFGQQMQAQMKTNAPLEMAQIDRVVVGTVASQPPVMVTYAKTPFDQAKVAGSAVPSDYGGYKLYPQGTARSLFFPDAKTIVLGPEDKLKSAIDRKGATSLGEKFSRLPTSGQITVMATKFTNANGERPAVLSAPGVNFDDVQSLTFDANVGQDIAFNMSWECRDSAAATTLQQAMEQSRAESLAQLQQQKSQLVPNPFIDVTKMQKLLEAVEKAIETYKIETSGNTITTRATVPGSIIQDAVEMAGPMMSTLMQSLPNSAGPPGGFTPPASASSPSENPPAPVTEHGEHAQSQ